MTGDEALDQAGGAEHGNEADDDDDRPPPLLHERGTSCSVAGVDQRPAEHQPRGTGDEHPGQLQQAVGQDETPEPAALPGRREQTRDLAQAGAVLDEHPRRGQAQEDPPCEREEAHLDVVGEHVGGERLGRLGGVVVLEGRLDV